MAPWACAVCDLSSLTPWAGAGDRDLQTVAGRFEAMQTVTAVEVAPVTVVTNG